MARHGVFRPSNPDGELFGLVEHDHWDPKRITGILDVEFETVEGQWVSPGTGRLGLALREGQETVAQRASRREDSPIVPGSSIKGAVRTVFELLTSSCDPMAKSRCKSKLLCPACTVFGSLGYRGRVSFDDAVPITDSSVEVAVAWTPVPHGPNREKTEGDFRLYDLRPWEPEAGQPPPPGGLRPLEREVFSGRFVTRLRFHNLTRQSLGALMICMGCSTESWQRFPLRLGGVKYDGKGAVRTQPVRTRLVAPDRKYLGGDSLRQTIEEWVRVSNGRPWASRCKATLVELCQVLNSESKKEGLS